MQPLDRLPNQLYLIAGALLLRAFDWLIDVLSPTLPSYLTLTGLMLIGVALVVGGGERMFARRGA